MAVVVLDAVEEWPEVSEEVKTVTADGGGAKGEGREEDVGVVVGEEAESAQEVLDDGRELTFSWAEICAFLSKKCVGQFS